MGFGTRGGLFVGLASIKMRAGYRIARAALYAGGIRLAIRTVCEIGVGDA
jgi:hypothetical protein